MDGLAPRADRISKELSCLAVFCGARDGKNNLYGEKAAELGSYLASKKIALVYGGGTGGLMGKVANSMLAAGGKTTGIIPKFFTEFVDYSAVGEEVVVPDMHTRKRIMSERADGFLALPGGIGTMEELLEVMTWAQLDLHTKPIGLLNIKGYYNHFLLALQHGINEGFIPASSENIDNMLIVSDDPKKLVDQLCSKWKTFN